VAERAAPPREAAARVRARRSGRARRAAREPRSRARRPTSLDPGRARGLVAGDPYLYIYTSGTTGLPKAARISHLRGMLLANGAMVSLGLAAGDRMYVALPLYHSQAAAWRSAARCSRARPA
jgi:long-subunit acyl-CoA synthetase (AMP-forming)